MKRTFNIVILLLSTISIYSQKYDYAWPMGYDKPSNQGWGLSSLDFSSGHVQKKFLYEIPNIRIGYTASFINNGNGNLILMSNGCSIMDGNGKNILNGDSLNPGRIFNSYCKFGSYQSYPVISGNFFITSKSWGETYLLIHQSSLPDNSIKDFVGDHIYFSIVERNAQGNFYVSKKNQDISTAYSMITTLSAVEHPDGEHWWIHFRAYQGNRHHLVLIGKKGIVQRDSQELGATIRSTNDPACLQPRFSPDGKKYVFATKASGIEIYDFDRTIGKLSVPKTIRTYDDSISCDGFCFSSNSKLFYYTKDTFVFQVNLEDTTLTSTEVGIAWGTDDNGWPYVAGLMHLGPDCRIYVSPSSTQRRMHVIHHPNVIGVGCGFEKSAIIMPTRIRFAVPNFMQFRSTGGAQLCDSSIQWFTTSIDDPTIMSGLKIYPNPASDILWLRIERIGASKHVLVFDLNGKEIRKYPIVEGVTNIPTGEIENGFYILTSDDKSWSRKVVIQH
ncbi:MAG: T9SS type A sorting domain-containing protein [Saprospiraceae bacterium]|nr:T9SS type A sorting domain-containing protein [Saprospiraceae bacterium]